MTIRQFAKENGIEIVGRLKKKSCEDEVFNYRTCEYMTEKRYIGKMKQEILSKKNAANGMHGIPKGTNINHLPCRTMPGRSCMIPF